jgi:hypothetical protein
MSFSRQTDINRRRNLAKNLRDKLKRGTAVRGPCVVCGATGDTCAHFFDIWDPHNYKWFCRKHLKKAGSFKPKPRVYHYRGKKFSTNMMRGVAQDLSEN